MKSAIAGIGGLIVIVLIILVATHGYSNAKLSTVVDVSWPNCGSSALSRSELGIVGVNGGLDFHYNKCVYEESKLFNNYSVYLNTGYPGQNYGLKFRYSPKRCSLTDSLCLAYNYGFNAAYFSIVYANLHSVHSVMWWLDVENSNSWTANTLDNRESLIGMEAALQKYTFLPTIGFYSYPGQWDIITDYWQNNLPDWVATGSSSYRYALSYCSGQNFTGGRTWLSQYTTNLDYNYICDRSYLAHLKN